MSSTCDTQAFAELKAEVRQLLAVPTLPPLIHSMTPAELVSYANALRRFDTNKLQRATLQAEITHIVMDGDLETADDRVLDGIRLVTDMLDVEALTALKAALISCRKEE